MAKPFLQKGQRHLAAERGEGEAMAHPARTGGDARESRVVHYALKDAPAFGAAPRPKPVIATLGKPKMIIDRRNKVGWQRYFADAETSPL